MEQAALREWIGRYERMWRTVGTDGLPELFTEDATYSPSPWRMPITGRAALAAFWEKERDGADEAFTLTSTVIAVDGDTGVARIEVSYADGACWRDLWLVRLDGNGRCTAFEEWPFAAPARRSRRS